MMREMCSVELVLNQQTPGKRSRLLRFTNAAMSGIYVKKIRTDGTWHVIYDDEWQLGTEPFRKGTIRRS